MDLTQILFVVDENGFSQALHSRQNIPESTRIKWAPEAAKLFDEQNMMQTQHKQWKIQLFMDGTAKVETQQAQDQACQVPSFQASYQIPIFIIEQLNDQEKIRHQQRFAFGSVLYEITTGHPPFHDVSQFEITENFRKGIFPADVQTLKNWAAILAYWDSSALNRIMLKYKEDDILCIEDNERGNRTKRLLKPALVGLGVTAFVLGAPLGLGVLGFSALGPVGGSVAAAWQASMGAVSAGSVFATLQSAAMGGTILGSVSGAAVLGTASSGVTAAVMWGTEGNHKLQPKDGLMEEFRRAFGKQREDSEIPSKL